ncbi:MAG: F0F1 ATP synthase subunit C [Alphaproteobacteria bacterium]|nr:F0F1 ATP synthase subunit C [Alphaproteobacteria bacterium]MCB9974622.1 F0F1 ATP synthase subunit C [Rhodospirillales bacterium]
MDPQVAKLIAGALVTLPAFGAAVGLGLYFAAYNQALARNPETKGALDEKYFLSLAFIEALGIIPIGIGAALLFG